ncbi:MAG: T9SS type A sorting domain-containing protein, partial [Ginsengibacter sp.]
VLIQYKKDYSNAIDGLDARKMTNTSENLAIKSGGKDLVVERRTSILETDTIFYKLTTVKVQKYRYEYIANDLREFGVEGFIEDTYLNTKTALNMEGKTTVDFSIENIPGSYANDRFRIVFKAVPGPKPMTFVSVKATQQADDIAVDWKVENETNVKEYEVEKSLDGTKFVKSATTPALNNGGGSYTFLDKDVMPGWNYYRIKSMDEKGKLSYSETVKVLIEYVAPLITVYPNPIVNGVINVHLVNQPAGNYKLRLLNGLGQTMVAKQITREKGTSIEPLTWNYKLARGNYRIEITKPDGGIKLITVIY